MVLEKSHILTWYFYGSGLCKVPGVNRYELKHVKIPLKFCISKPKSNWRYIYFKYWNINWLWNKWGFVWCCWNIIRDPGSVVGGLEIHQLECHKDAVSWKIYSPKQCADSSLRKNIHYWVWEGSGYAWILNKTRNRHWQISIQLQRNIFF